MIRASLAATAAFLVLATGVPALGQGGTSGSINGTVADHTGAMLPGVTVTATSPSMMGTPTSLTNESGQYRFPSLTPGTYSLTFELPGFTRVTREGIIVNIGFTATVNVQLSLASLQESVTVTGESPIVDVTNTNIQYNFTAETMKLLPNARDIWSLIGEAPGMMVTSFDVGGSRAGTQTGYSAFGLSGQVRVQIDGVNTTEGTGAAGFYYDFGSFDEVQLGGDANDASAATPGLQLNAVLKSGGNQFKGDAYFDYENQSLQGRNVDDRLARLGVGAGDRVLKYLDPNFNIGGPIQRDRLWFFTSVRNQQTGVTRSGFPVEEPSNFEFETKLQNLSYKVTYAPTPNHKIGHYIQLGRKLQPHRDASSTRYFDSVFKQDSISYAANIDLNSVVSKQFFFNTGVKAFGYNWPDLPYGAGGALNENLQVRRSDNASGNTAGSFNPRRNNRRRIQFDWSGTLFKDDWFAGSHAFKMGYVSENEWQAFKDEGFLGAYSLTYNSTGGRPDFTVPLRVTIRNTPRQSLDGTWHHGAFLNDQWMVSDRITLNLGLRWDYYSSYYPEQDILPGPFRDFFYGGAALPNGYSIPRTAFADSFKVPALSGIAKFPMNLGPRIGVAWDLFGDNKTVVKGNWGRYSNNPGLIGDNINPAASTTYTFNWNDLNNDARFQMNELGTFSSSSGGVNQRIDPDLTNEYTDSMSVWLEREVFANASARIGYVFKDYKNSHQNVELQRVYGLYTNARTIADPGPDGFANTGDDGQPFVVWDIPANVTIPPSRTLLQVRPEILENDKSINLTFNKRMANRFSMLADFIYNWDYGRGRPQTPNAERFNEVTETSWGFKLLGTYQAPFGVSVSPVLRHQSGDQLPREVRVALRTGDFDYDAEAPTAYREDNIWIFDTRASKRIKIRGAHTLSLFFDAFNIANRNAAQAMDSLVGRRTTTVNGESVNYQRFLRPTSILPPRVYRVGFNYAF